MKTIKTEKDLANFLKTIARQSVVDASLNLFESDSYIAKFANELEKEMDILGEQGEEESAEEPVEEPEAEAETAEEPAKTEPKKPKRNPAAEKALSLPDYEVNQEVTFEQILTAINLVRAGNSTKNKKTKQEILDYFEKLDEEEKGVLLIYLKELAKIITGAIDGEEGHDPSDATTFFDISIRQDDKSQDSQKTTSKPSSDKSAAQPDPQQQKQATGEEDVTPPIRVNEKQDYSGLKIIRG